MGRGIEVLEQLYQFVALQNGPMETVASCAMETGIGSMVKLSFKIESNKIQMDDKGNDVLGSNGKARMILKDQEVYKMEIFMWMEEYKKFWKDRRE